MIWSLRVNVEGEVNLLFQASAPLQVLVKGSHQPKPSSLKEGCCIRWYAHLRKKILNTRVRAALSSSEEVDDGKQKNMRPRGIRKHDFFINII